MQLKVLIIEDEPPIATMLRYNIEHDGHETTTVIGVPPGIGITDDGYLQAFDDSGPVTIDLREYAVAFVDGRLGSDSLPGWKIAPHLEKAGVVCVGMSASDNAQFVGTSFVCQDKTRVVSFIREHLDDAYQLGCARALERSQTVAA